MGRKVYGGKDIVQVDRFGSQEVLQKITAEIEAKRNAPQELWVSLRGFAVADMATVPLGLLHDVLEFCLAVFDSVEPNITSGKGALTM